MVVFTHRPDVSPWERVGLDQCAAVLGRHDLHLVCPRGMPTDAYEALLPGLRIVHVPPRRMAGYLAYSDLKTSSMLFRHFGERYRFTLCHEPDVFVFRDDLDEWCERGYHYVGAPFWKPSPEPGGEPFMPGGGNSGFSLRDNDAHVRVNRTLRLLERPTSFRRAPAGSSLATRLRDVPLVTLKALGIGNSTNEWLRNPYLRWRGNTYYEDVFWSQMVPLVLPWFRVADPLTSLEFSFELEVERCFELAGGRLPFGCHGWYRFALDVWRPHIEALGHELPDHVEFPPHGSESG